MTYELSDELFTRAHVLPGDPVPEYNWPYAEHESVLPKFQSVAAAIMWCWSLDSSHDEDAGDAEYGNGWNALFRSERAILRADSQGFIYAWRLEDGVDVDAAWTEIEKGAVYPDDPDPDDSECEGHRDTDDALTSGAGAGEAVYCDGTCREA